MAQVNLNNDPSQIITGNDNIAIVKIIATVRGGRALNVTGFAPDVIGGGHPIIKETSSGDYKPMPVVTSGGVTSIGGITGGTGYTNNGTYTNVSLTGGSGTGAKGTVVVAGNSVTGVTITTAGTGYRAGDILSAAASTIGTNGSGFQFALTAVDNTATVYASLPAGHIYQGSLIASIETKKAFAAIMTIGVINPVACPYDFATIASEFKTAVPLIDQRAD
ncbi:hypothetical protein SNE25_21005 [Mucilaginibacter sabulilitoris]|uniref:Uncharacterized protein n=1 Tax=Mucilaginibacter sabulilitoris TaxID=1173583 RepID=A0ABZ0TF51_9SPHI|nr:hypothetical protein [Mucilaginibacter sabulilitoris]WPU91800.1 hypothetical protein SNE25_21005 [Mucilaginibacter sabulilitoris]